MPSRRPAIPTTSAPFVGRFTELSLAKALLREARKDRPSLLLVGGEDGVGKTRLLAEIADQARTMSFLVVVVHVPQHDGTMLAGVTRLLEGLAAAHGEAAMRQSMAGLPPTLGLFLPTLAPYRDPRTSDPGVLPDPAAEEARLHVAVMTLLSRLLGHRPTALILDDLHHMGDGELKLFGNLARNLTSHDPATRTRHQLLAVGSHRLPLPEGRLQGLAEAARREGFETIRLPPLTERDAFELARGMQPTFPEELRGALYRKTGGNPFFVIEALKEAEVGAGGEVSLPDLPPGVRGLVQARLRRFDDRAQQVFTTAATLGDRFSIDILRSVTGLPLGELLSTVGKLVEENVFERDHEDRSFRFTHTFVKDSIYEVTPQAERQGAHRAAAEALESEIRDSSRFARLAYHYGRSGEREREARNLLAAGLEALRRFDAREAIAKVEGSLLALSGLDERTQAKLGDVRARALSGLVRARKILGENDRALQAAQDLLGVARKEGDPALLVDALRDLAEMLAETNEASQALGHLDEALRIAREAGARRELARVVLLQSQISGRLGGQTSHKLLAEGIQLAEEVGDDELLAEALVREAVFHFERGDDRAAEESYTRALRIARLRKLPRLTALARSARAAVLSQRGEYERAMREFQAALLTQRRIGDVRATGVSLMNIGALNAHMGRYERAIELHKKAIAILKTIGIRGDLAFSLFSIANIEHDRRRYDKALEAYEEALVIRKEMGERSRIAEIMNNMGVTYFEMGDYGKARDRLEVANAICLEIGYIYLGMETNLYLGAVMAVTGDPDEGRATIRRALDDAIAHELKAQICTGRYLLGFVTAGLGSLDEGVSEIRAAIEEARRLGLTPYVERFERTLAEIEGGGAEVREPRPAGD